MRENEVESLFNRILTKPKVKHIVIFDNKGKVLKASNTNRETLGKIASESLVILETVLSSLKKYGSGQKINLLSIRINTDKGNIYVIKSKYFSIAFLQEIGLTVDEKKALQILEKIQEILM